MPESRGHSSFTAMPPGVLVNSRPVSEEDIQIALAPYIQTYLSQTGRRHSCCSVMLPVAFERAAPKSWLDPTFDSPVLEGQYRASVFPQIRLRFRFALLYILLCSLVWMIYFCTDTGPTRHHVTISVAFAILIAGAAALMWLTYAELYRAYTTLISAGTAIGLCSVSLLFLVCTEDSFSPLGHFAICVTVLMLIYTVIPLRLWQNVGIAATYSVAFEWLQHQLESNYYIVGKSAGFGQKILLLRLLLQLCVHLVGAHVLVMNVVRMRGTFMKVGQNLLVRRQLEMEKQLKEKMIHSVMPPKVADMLLKEVHPTMGMGSQSVGGLSGRGGGSGRAPMKRHSQRPRTSNDVKSLFRPFHMHSMDNVSILFADIVGFTKMSSTKTAEQLVEILNDLFERFDELCTNSGCEKISTLGDCYYCVSGCPEPRADHAECCVEMGLGMIEAMRVFDVQRNEEVRMRVGVHTGTVLCGIVGTRRVKFDVWSNDVSFANKMESSGRPEQVHISEQTSNFLGDRYHLEEGEDVDGHHTYFVLGRRKDRSDSYNPTTSANTSNAHSDFEDAASGLLGPAAATLSLSCRAAANSAAAAAAAHSNGFTNGVALSLSATNISAVQPSVPPASPVGPSSSANSATTAAAQQFSASLQPSPILGANAPGSGHPAPKRNASFGKVTKFLSSKQNSRDSPTAAAAAITILARDPQHADYPTIVVSTRSLPDSLNSAAGGPEALSNGTKAAEASGQALQMSHSTTSTTTTTTSKTRRGWRVPRFLQRRAERKTSTGSASAAEEQPCLSRDQVDSSRAPILSTGAYSSIPIVIEIPPQPPIITTTNCLDVPRGGGGGSLASSRSPELGGSSSYSPHSLYDVDIIDVRSYISQSRSDISPFARSGSYRSQTAKCNGGGGVAGGAGVGVTSTLAPEMSPIGRPRALTVHSPTPQLSAAAYQAAAASGGGGGGGGGVGGVNPWDILSICPSAHSRKDSGIRSNSRRSSIQVPGFALNGQQQQMEEAQRRQPPPHSGHRQRVSGYFTSSESSLGAACADDRLPDPVLTPAAQHPDPLGACLQQLRKQSDLQLIRCVRDNARSQRSYLVKPPLSAGSLFFKSPRMESEFRGNAHRFGCELQNEGPPTLATPKYNTYIDILIGMVVYFAIAAALFLLTATGESADAEGLGFRIWAGLFGVFSVAQFAALLLFTKQICHFSQAAGAGGSGQQQQLQLGGGGGGFSQTVSISSRRPSSAGTGRANSATPTEVAAAASCDDNVLEWLSSWYPWHICLAVLMSLPVVLICVNFCLLQDLRELDVFEYHYGFMVFVCIVHFCNFTQLNCWMRNCLAVLTAVVFVGIALGQLGAISQFWEQQQRRGAEGGNGTWGAAEEVEEADGAGMRTERQNSFQAYHVEIYLDLLLVLVLVWFLNREFEIGYRLTFYGNAVALKDKVQVQNMKNQADMLLHNIIPKHVAEHLKNTAKYSENHRRVAIIFASIVNFNELYDESYLGGKEYLRVLNELIGDFDELLSRPAFRAVEKIKTIGSTFMAAAGLDPKCRGDGDEHVAALMRFAVAMQRVVDDFNKDLLEFNLVLRIGFNVGEVTAGVIGTSKLHYDIWGDAVNVASRMDSTGVAGRIQVGAQVVEMLRDRWEFEPRGEVYVKGKDHMEVFLVRQDEEEAGGEGGGDAAAERDRF